MVAFEQSPDELLVPLRRVMAELPEVVEVQRLLHVTFKVGRRNVADVATVRSDDETVTVMSVRIDEAERDILLRSGHPFFRVARGNELNRIAVVLDDKTDWDEMREIVTDSYLLVAPKWLVAIVTERL